MPGDGHQLIKRGQVGGYFELVDTVVDVVEQPLH
jgi:hypothetical protein